jgi:hypothetical protein
MNNRLTVSPLSFSLLLTLLILFTTPAISEGINCQGSFQCFPLIHNPLKQVVDSIKSIDPNASTKMVNKFLVKDLYTPFFRRAVELPEVAS